MRIMTLGTLFKVGGPMLALAGLLAGCGGTTCPAGQVADRHNQCVEPSPPMTTKLPSEPDDCPANEVRSGGASCECISGYTRSPNKICIPKPAGRVDLAVTSFKFTAAADGSNLLLCFRALEDQVGISNLGDKDSPRFKIGIGLINLTKDEVNGCEFEVPGVGAGMQASYGKSGTCCTIPLVRLPTGSQYVAFALADTDESTDDIDPDNNLAIGKPFNRLTGDTAEQLVGGASQAGRVRAADLFNSDSFLNALR